VSEDDKPPEIRVERKLTRDEKKAVEALESLSEGIVKSFAEGLGEAFKKSAVSSHRLLLEIHIGRLHIVLSQTVKPRAKT